MTPYRTNVRPPGVLRRATTIRQRAAVAWRRWWRRRLAPVMRFVSLWGWARELEKMELALDETNRELVRIRDETKALLREHGKEEAILQAQDVLTNKLLDASPLPKLPPLDAPLPKLPPLISKTIHRSRRKRR